MRIDAFERETEASDWLELSENLCARANTNLAAAERIVKTTISSVILLFFSIDSSYFSNKLYN